MDRYKLATFGGRRCAAGRARRLAPENHEPFRVCAEAWRHEL